MENTVTQNRKGISQNEGSKKQREFWLQQEGSAMSWKALACADLVRWCQFNFKKM